jgi:hypothetical protein
MKIANETTRIQNSIGYPNLIEYEFKFVLSIPLKIETYLGYYKR